MTPLEEIGILLANKYSPKVIEMRKTSVNILCGLGIVLPLVLLLYPMPFIMWHPLAATILRMTPAISAQILFCKIAKYAWIRIIPLVLTGFLVGWGIFLYFTSEFWIDSTFMGLLTDYISPFIGCAIVWGLGSSRKKIKSK